MSQTLADFYILNKPKDLHFVCRLIEKVYKKGHQIFVVCENDTEAKRLDDLLWTYHPTSFIPHQRMETNVGIHTQTTTPVIFNDVLINLSTDIPEGYHRFNRILEVVFDEEPAKTVCRAHYRTYKEQGFTLSTHIL